MKRGEVTKQTQISNWAMTEELDYIEYYSQHQKSMS